MSDSLFEFDLNVEPELATDTPPAGSPKVSVLEKWADEQLSKPSASGPLFFDIETGGRPEEELKFLYHEKTLEEFSESCDKRWKPETVAAKFEEHKVSAWQEFVGRAALSPTTGRVLLIGVLDNGKFQPYGDGDEAANLTNFWDLEVEAAVAAKRRIIGHNSHSFDLPFMIRRSWLLGVPVPREVRQGRYWNPLFVDTMEAWSFGAREYTSLNDIARFFGVGQKTEGIKGKDFAKYWFGSPEEQKAAIAYNETDLRLTAAIAAKMGLV
jgi:hypothetical protein